MKSTAKITSLQRPRRDVRLNTLLPGRRPQRARLAFIEAIHSVRATGPPSAPDSAQAVVHSTAKPGVAPNSRRSPNTLLRSGEGRVRLRRTPTDHPLSGSRALTAVHGR